jgi:hypothetical protein
MEKDKLLARLGDNTITVNDAVVCSLIRNSYLCEKFLSPSMLQTK